MSAHHNPLQRAVVGILAVVCALRNGALDALVGVAVHIGSSFFGDGISMLIAGTFIRNFEIEN